MISLITKHFRQEQTKHYYAVFLGRISVRNVNLFNLYEGRSRATKGFGLSTEIGTIFLQIEV